MSPTPDSPRIDTWILLRETVGPEPTLTVPVVEPESVLQPALWRRMLLGLACVAASALPGAGGATSTAGQDPAAAVAPAAESGILVGEWVHLAGRPLKEMLPEGWGVEAPPEPEGSGVWTGRVPLLTDLGPALRVRPVSRALALRVPLASMALPVSGEEGPRVEVMEQAVVTLPAQLDGYSHHYGLAAWVEGVNYADPAGIGLPLRRARGVEDHRISPSFRVRDFATRDGAPYLRVAPDLVSGLERMHGVLGSLTVISGYRHPRYNARPEVGGARYSRHQSGQAADVWSAEASTLEMALAAIQTMGCGIGIGLGRNTIHVDVRGHLATWTYRGAPLSAADFDAWVRSLCGDVGQPRAPGRRGEPWPLSTDGADEAERVHLEDGAAALEEAPTSGGQTPAEGESPERPRVGAVIREALATFARDQMARRGPGVVVVDVGEHTPLSVEVLRERARYLRVSHPDVPSLGVAALLDWVDARAEGAHFTYVVRRGEQIWATGIAPAAPRAGRWFLVVSSSPTLADAEASLSNVHAPLRAAGFGAVLRAAAEAEGTRYDVVVGPFGSEPEAERAAAQAASALPADARVERLP